LHGRGWQNHHTSTLSKTIKSNIFSICHDSRHISSLLRTTPLPLTLPSRSSIVKLQCFTRCRVAASRAKRARAVRSAIFKIQRAWKLKLDLRRHLARSATRIQSVLRMWSCVRTYHNLRRFAISIQVVHLFTAFSNLVSADISLV
jgi:hypothetical protein